VYWFDAASHSGIQEKEVELVKGIPETLLQQLHEDWLLVGWWRLVLDIEATTQKLPGNRRGPIRKSVFDGAGDGETSLASLAARS